MESAITAKEELKRKEEEKKLLAARELAQEVKRLREAERWTQTDLALKLGVSQPVVSDMELGRYNFPLDSIVRLARAFSISPFKLVAIYLGENPDQFNNREGELLANIISLVNEYLNDSDARNLADYAALRQRLKEAREEEADILADLTPDVHPAPPPATKPQQIITNDATENI